MISPRFSPHQIVYVVAKTQITVGFVEYVFVGERDDYTSTTYHLAGLMGSWTEANLAGTWEEAIAKKMTLNTAKS